MDHENKPQDHASETGDHRDVSITVNHDHPDTPKAENKAHSQREKAKKFLWYWTARPIGTAIGWIDSHNGLMTAAATVIMAIFTGLLAFYAYDQGRITQGQMGIMRDQMIAAERPWVSVSFVPKGPLVFDKDGGTLEVDFSLKNTGHTPAVSVWPTDEGYFPNSGEEIIAKQQDICAQQAIMPFGETIFPGDTIIYNSHVTFSPEEVAKTKAPIQGMPFLFRNPTIGICINYRFTFDQSEPHQTGLAWQVFRKGKSADGRITPENKTIPLSELVINSRSRLSLGNRAN